MMAMSYSAAYNLNPQNTPLPTHLNTSRSAADNYEGEQLLALLQ